jgi:lysozyme
MEIMIKQDLTDNQLSALISFTYNVGLGAFKSSRLLRDINSGITDQKAITTDFTNWDHVDGEVNEGLHNRRLKEAQVYFYET